MFPELAREHGATLLPFLLEGVAGNARLNQNDGIHPNDAGERIVADNVWRTLQPLLRRQEDRRLERRPDEHEPEPEQGAGECTGASSSPAERPEVGGRRLRGAARAAAQRGIQAGGEE